MRQLFYLERVSYFLSTKLGQDQSIQARREEIAPFVSQNVQSGRGRLFEMLADLVDEDGALTEIEDMGDLADFLGDGLE